jgi:hypothetical protein
MDGKQMKLIVGKLVRVMARRLAELSTDVTLLYVWFTALKTLELKRE